MMPSPSPPAEAPPAKEETASTAPKQDRSRSRSPRRSPPRKPKNFSGLKWKDNKRDDRDRGHDRRDRRDYDRDDRRGGDRFDRRDRDRDDRRDDRGGRVDRRDDRGGRDDRRRDDRHPDRRDDRRDDRRHDSRRDDRRDDRPRDDRDRKPREDRKPKPVTAPAPMSTEPMILVTINDRLGTKTQVPCLPSDPIKVLKAMVAAKIGRPVHEIMLKRQGERPFHDNLQLIDYNISNGVQIDLELNTGD